MSDDKLKISWSELSTPDVEARMEQRATAVATREHYDRQLAKEPDPFAARNAARWQYNPLIYMAFFGLLGAVFGWLIAQPLYRPDPVPQARQLVHDADNALALYRAGRITAEQAQSSLAAIQLAGQSNPYFKILHDETLSPAQRDQLLNRQQWMQFISNVLFYGLCGMSIAAAMAMADSIVGRNYAGAVIHGSAGAVAGLVGAVVASLFIHQLGSAVMNISWIHSSYRIFVARAAIWVLLGLFLTLAPAVVLRSTKRLLIGLLGGAIGGLIGGLLYQPVISLTGSENLAILIALVIVALVAGAATGLIENAAKSGWLKVTQGLIAGKQFILYRNPTYLGSAANCEIYLFKDRRVGRRHAAIRQIPGGFELENLPLGEPTYVNGLPVSRAKLFAGDKIRVGATEFLFQEKDGAD